MLRILSRIARKLGLVMVHVTIARRRRGEIRMFESSFPQDSLVNVRFISYLRQLIKLNTDHRSTSICQSHTKVYTLLKRANPSKWRKWFKEVSVALLCWYVSFSTPCHVSGQSSCYNQDRSLSKHTHVGCLDHIDWAELFRGDYCFHKIYLACGRSLSLWNLV